MGTYISLNVNLVVDISRIIKRRNHLPFVSLWLRRVSYIQFSLIGSGHYFSTTRLHFLGIATTAAASLPTLIIRLRVIVIMNLAYSC